MANNVKNIVSGKPNAAGGVWMGELGLPVPTDPTTELDAGFVDAGYVSEDGLTETTDRSTDKIKAWGGDTVKVVQTEFSVQYKFTLIESLSNRVLSAVYGEQNVKTVAANTQHGNQHTVTINSDQLPHRSWVFEVKDGDARIRIFVADGQVTEIGEVTYTDGDLVGFEVTVEALFSDSIKGQAVKMIDDGQKAAA